MLHEKIDFMKEQELLALTEAVRELSTRLETLSTRIGYCCRLFLAWRPTRRPAG